MKTWAIFIVSMILLSSVAFAVPNAQVELTPISLYESNTIDFNLSVNNFLGNEIVKKIEILLPGFSVLNATEFFGWNHVISDNKVSWTEGTIETNMWKAIFPFKAKAGLVDSDEQISVPVTLSSDTGDAITIIPDMVRPQARFVSGNITSVPAVYTFGVTFSDNKAVDISSLDSNDIRVTGPNDFEELASFVEVDVNSDGTPRTARYRFAAPGGNWDKADNGSYTLWMRPNQVSDSVGNFAVSEMLKPFAVSGNSEGIFVLESYNLISQTPVGGVVFDYTYTVTLYNSSCASFSNLRFELLDTPANITIIESEVNLPYIGPMESATSEGTVTVRIDRSVPTNLYNAPWRVTFEREKLPGDLNGDGFVNEQDLDILSSHWLETLCRDSNCCEGADVDRSSSVDFDDFAKFAEYWRFSTSENSQISLSLTLDKIWMYQNLPGATGSKLAANVSIAADPMKNSSYTYEWKFILPSDVSVAPSITGGGGVTDAFCTFAASDCTQPGGLSDSGVPIKIRVTVKGNDYGNMGSAETGFGTALLGDINNDCVVNIADRSIINAFWKNGSAGPYLLRDCDLNCDGIVNVADRSIEDAIYQGTLG